MDINIYADVFEQVEAILAQAGILDPTYDAFAIVEASFRLADVANQTMCALAMAAERAAGAPLGHVTGLVHFMGVECLTAPGALVPREETELLGRSALEVLAGTNGGGLRLIDMCCGSGNLACAIAQHDPRVRAWASDLMDDAVRLACANVRRLNLSHQVEVVQSDLFAALTGRGLEGTIDVIVCNPPYISTGRLAGDRAHLLTHEPRAAFDGGPYGLSIFQRVVRDAAKFLKPGGTLLFEIGIGQDRQVSQLFDRTARYEPAVTINDRQGHARVVAGRLLSV